MRRVEVTVVWEENVPTEYGEVNLPVWQRLLQDEVEDRMWDGHPEDNGVLNVRVDIKMLPRQGGGHTAGLEAAASTADELHSIVPDAGVIHPWDQGLWIFPEDHPMHRYERLAKAMTTHPDPGFHPEGEIEKRVFLEAGQKLLTP